MNKSELIDKWQKKHSSILEDYNYKYRGGNNTLADSECRGRMKDVLDFIEDIKNLNGETVKLREYCPFCGSENIDKSDPPFNDCADCYAKWAI